MLTHFKTASQTASSEGVFKSSSLIIVMRSSAEICPYSSEFNTVGKNSRIYVQLFLISFEQFRLEATFQIPRQFSGPRNVKYMYRLKYEKFNIYIAALYM
jgi:hypothetical protein